MIEKNKEKSQTINIGSPIAANQKFQKKRYKENEKEKFVQKTKITFL